MESKPPKLAEVDTTKTQEAIRDLIANEPNLDEIFKATVLEALERR